MCPTVFFLGYVSLSNRSDTVVVGLVLGEMFASIAAICVCRLSICCIRVDICVSIVWLDSNNMDLY